MLHRKGERRIKRNREQEFKSLMKRTGAVNKGDWTHIYDWVKFLVLATIENGQQLKAAQSQPFPKDRGE